MTGIPASAHKEVIEVTGIPASAHKEVIEVTGIPASDYKEVIEVTGIPASECRLVLCFLGTMNLFSPQWTKNEKIQRYNVRALVAAM